MGCHIICKMSLKMTIVFKFTNLRRCGGRSMGNVLVNTLWEMLKVDVLTKEAEQKEQIEKIKDIIKKEKNDC